MLYFIIGCLIIGLFISFSIGWWCGERHVHKNTMVGIPSTSTNSAMDAILRASIAVVESRDDIDNLSRTLDVLQALLAKQHQ